jgi:hypothetical protein
MPIDARLHAALRAAPRRYRMPPLPRDGRAAEAAGVETALAFAIESARAAKYDGAPLAPGAPGLFQRSLAHAIADAMTQDAAFRAAVVRSRDPEVREYLALAAQAPQDRRAVRAAVDAVAHPGKLRGAPAGDARDRLERLHQLAQGAQWDLLAPLLPQLADALGRLARIDALAQAPAVARYLDLLAQQGPAAGSETASAQGRAAAQAGAGAEDQVAAALERVAAWLAPPGRLARSLLMPPGFPGEAGKAKDEWDAALLRGNGIVLLAEVKASPQAATSDFSRLYRGLVRLAHARPGASYTFASAGGPVTLSGSTLAELRPHGRTLPPQVIYLCTAPAPARTPMLGAASRAILLAEPASLAFAQALAAGESPSADSLAPAWEALGTSARLRSVLHQYETAVTVREAMLHPDDLLEAAGLS